LYQKIPAALPISLYFLNNVDADILSFSFLFLLLFTSDVFIPSTNAFSIQTNSAACIPKSLISAQYEQYTLPSDLACSQGRLLCHSANRDSVSPEGHGWLGHVWDVALPQ